MITTWIVVAVALAALGALAYMVARSRSRQRNLQEALQAFQALDIEAFRNLVDTTEEEFLRAHLPPQKFRRIKRQRTWAAMMYAWEAGQAATALAEVGHAAQRSPDPQVAATGVQVAESAFQLRLQTIGACLRLATEIVLPEVRSRATPPLVEQYERTAETIFRLGGFSTAVRLEAERAVK